MASRSHFFFVVRDGTVKIDYIPSCTIIDLNMDIEKYRDPREFPISHEILAQFGKGDLVRLAGAGYSGLDASIKHTKAELIDLIHDKWSDIVDAVEEHHLEWIEIGLHRTTASLLDTEDKDRDFDTDDALYQEIQLPEGYLNDGSDFGEMPDTKPDGKPVLKVLLYQPAGQFLFDVSLESPFISIMSFKEQIIAKISTFNPSSALKVSDFKLLHEGFGLKDEALLVECLVWGDVQLKLVMQLMLKGGGVSSVKRSSAFKPKSQSFKETYATKCRAINKTVLAPLACAEKAEATLMSFASEVEQKSAEDALFKLLSSVSDDDIKTIDGILGQKGGTVGSKLDECASLVFGMQELSTVKTNIEHVMDGASSLLQFAVSKLSASSGSEVKSFRALVDKCKFVKLGQKMPTAQVEDMDL